MRTMNQMEKMVEEKLRQHVIEPLLGNSLFQASTEPAEFDASTIAEARILNIVREIAERGITECQCRRRPQKAFYVA